MPGCICRTRQMHATVHIDGTLWVLGFEQGATVRLSVWWQRRPNDEFLVRMRSGWASLKFVLASQRKPGRLRSATWRGVKPRDAPAAKRALLPRYRARFSCFGNFETIS